MGGRGQQQRKLRRVSFEGQGWGARSSATATRASVSLSICVGLGEGSHSCGKLFKWFLERLRAGAGGSATTRAGVSRWGWGKDPIDARVKRFRLGLELSVCWTGPDARVQQTMYTSSPLRLVEPAGVQLVSVHVRPRKYCIQRDGIPSGEFSFSDSRN